ncbi:MAG TPA: hypothetical protein DCR14_11885, partial [Acidimicrobiaceae bacterium]|nr:hypothetical protein [Acidimicrobiaceae bacterium]
MSPTTCRWATARRRSGQGRPTPRMCGWSSRGTPPWGWQPANSMRRKRSSRGASCSPAASRSWWKRSRCSVRSTRCSTRCGPAPSTPEPRWPTRREKFFQPLLAGSVPIYRGAPNVADFAPAPNCYIDADDFDGPADLARFLRSLTDDQYLA